jgi:hypothetical protein
MPIISRDELDTWGSSVGQVENPPPIDDPEVVTHQQVGESATPAAEVDRVYVPAANGVLDAREVLVGDVACFAETARTEQIHRSTLPGRGVAEQEGPNGS